MKPLAKFLLLCFFLLIGVAFTQAFACQPASSHHIKPKLYVTENAKCGRYGTLQDVFLSDNDFVFSIEDEDDDYEGRRHESAVNHGAIWSGSYNYLDNISSAASYQIDPTSFYTSQIYLAQGVLRI